MDSFKRELQDLLRKYPQVKNVRFDITETVSLETTPVTMAAPTVLPVVPEAKPEYVSPQKQALTAAEMTIQALTKGANIKVMQ